MGETFRLVYIEWEDSYGCSPDWEDIKYSLIKRGYSKTVAHFMAWETRGGRRYYYEKKRVDGRVVSRYVGCGLAAQLAENVNEMLRIEREVLREESRRQAALDREIDTQIRTAMRAVKLVTDAALFVAGYHKHKGQWRRKRGHIGAAKEANDAQD